MVVKFGYVPPLTSGLRSVSSQVPTPFRPALMRPARRILCLPMTEQMDSLLPTSSESPPMISCSLLPALSLAPTPLSSIKVLEPAMQTRVSPNPTLNCTDIENFDPPSTL
ncbi:UNVERIFIED_CONTAM: hypothetical protein Sradi_2090800 [Sesamum radiatum]|uniref:Uncharacterized protein n=1 Tax=Sesamum radiatum TaxID=300843 RepID=A0AAW2THU0_SESRA